MGALHPKVAAWKREATEDPEGFKTSGKIMRRVLKAVILGKDPGDISTIENEGSVEEARDAWEQMRARVTTGT